MSKTIQFTDTSTNANTYFWDFGDGNTSTERNPIHTYQDDGEYVVVHTVTNDFGEASTEQTISLGITQVDEEIQIDDTEPNPINPPFGYLPPNVLLTGTLSPQGQWYWDGYTWNTLEPNPINPPFGYLPPDNLLIDTLSPQGQWIWNGQVWNLNVGADEQEPTEEQTVDKELSSYQITLNEVSEAGVDNNGIDIDLINFNVNQSEPYIENSQIDLVVFFVTGYDHSPFDVQLRPFITTPENLNIELIEDNSFISTDDGNEYRDARYRFIMPNQDVEITATAFLP